MLTTPKNDNLGFIDNWKGKMSYNYDMEVSPFGKNEGPERGLLGSDWQESKT